MERNKRISKIEGYILGAMIGIAIGIVQYYLKVIDLSLPRPVRILCTGGGAACALIIWELGRDIIKRMKKRRER